MGNFASKSHLHRQESQSVAWPRISSRISGRHTTICERRVWTITSLGNGRYKGTAADVIGEAEGLARGNALRWGYTLRLPVDNTTYDVQFDDWMYLMDDRVMLNKARMSKFGIDLGEVTLSFYKP